MGDGAEFVTMREIARRLGRPPGTLYSLRHRGQFPEPDLVVADRSFWLWPQVAHRLDGH